MPRSTIRRQQFASLPWGGTSVIPRPLTSNRSIIWAAAPRTSFPTWRRKNRLRSGLALAIQARSATESAFHCPITDTERSVYSLRHTAICMRIILSHGKVNIFNLAKNAGTSVEQIERFYAKHLPLSREMAKNLQSFGGE